MNTVIDAGALRERLEILELQETGPGVWRWETARRTWGQVETEADTGRRNLFSSVGIGARSAALVLRRQGLTLHNAIRWRGQHLFLSAITPRGRGHLDVSAALVAPAACMARSWHSELGPGNRPKRVDDPPVTFPGVLTEKYIRYQAEETYAKAAGLYVLVTPNAIRLKEGALVTVQGGPAAAVYNVQVCHLLDEYKNEYEIAFSRDI